MIRVRFLHSHRNYNAGEVALFDTQAAESLIRGGHAERVLRSSTAPQVEADKMVKPPRDEKRPKKGPGVVTK